MGDKKHDSKGEGPLANVDRSSLGGFKRYWSHRQDHFHDLFGMQYLDENLREAYQEQQEAFRWKGKRDNNKEYMNKEVSGQC